MRGELQTYADANHLEVEFHSRIQTNDLRELYNRSKVCAYPPIMEPGGLVPLEAQACGTPVVAVNEGGNREELIHGVTGFLTDRDPQEFGAAIERLIRDDQLATRMGEAGVDWVSSERTWESIVPRLEQALQTLVSLEGRHGR
jgi:glycosyltransferase involved in cell wall biosynthesis